MVRTIKLIQMLVIVSGLLLTGGARADGLSSVYSAQITSRHTQGGGGGGDFVWPWGLEVPFPFEDVDGVWKVEDDGRIYYFGFRRVQEKRLVITQFDASRCMVIGTGPGLIRNKSQKYVVAQITVKPSGEAYRMAIYTFAEADSPQPPAAEDGVPSIPEHVVVARISRMTTRSQEIAVQMVRISDRTEYKCLGQGKKLKF